MNSFQYLSVISLFISLIALTLNILLFLPNLKATSCFRYKMSNDFMIIHDESISKIVISISNISAQPISLTGISFLCSDNQTYPVKFVPYLDFRSSESKKEVFSDLPLKNFSARQSHILFFECHIPDNVEIKKAIMYTNRRTFKNKISEKKLDIEEWRKLRTKLSKE